MLPDKPIPFGEWRPDVALLDVQFAAIAENVFPGPNAYLPFPGLAPITTTALPAPARGLTFARTATGSYVIYAGTATHLYRWNGSAWVDVSRTVGGAYNMADGDRWSFAQFGTSLYATHIGDALQSINVDSGTNFAATAGSPPHATSVAVIGDFLVLSGLVGNRRVIQWSSINNPTEWIIGTNLGDMQEFPDGGPVFGVCGGEVGFVIQDRSLRTMQFLPGDTTTIFSFSRIEREKGCAGKYGFLFTRGIVFLVSEDGFYGIGAPTPAIGDHIVNQWYLDHSDPGRRSETFAFADPRKPHVMWAFYSNSAATNYDRVIIFDWSLNKWTYSTQAAQAWSTLASAEFDLDTDVPGDPLDPPLDSVAPSLDSVAYIGGRPVPAGIDINGILCFLDGPPLAATVETGEVHLSQPRRTFVSSAYPMVDALATATPAPGLQVTIGERERLQDGTTWGNPQGVESTGSAAVYSSSRLHRFRVQVPHAATWTYAMGVAVEAQPDGEGY